MRRSIRFSWKYYQNNRIKLFISLLLKLVKASLLIYIPLIYSHIINNLIVKKETEIIKYLFILTVTQVFSIILNYLTKKIDLNITRNVNLFVRNEVAKKLYFIPSYELNGYNQGKIHTLLTTDALVVSNFISIITNASLDVFTIIGVGIVVVSKNWVLSLLLLSTYPLTYLINYIYSKKIKKFAKKLVEATDNFISYVKNNAINLEDIKIQNGANKTLQEFKKQTIIGKYITAKKNELQINNSTWVSFIGFLNYILLTIIGVYYVFKGKLLLGIFVAFNSYAKTLSSSLDSIVNLKVSLQPALVSLERLIEISKIYSSYLNSDKTKVDINTALNNISYKDVGLTLNNKNILKKINLDFIKGNIYGIKGANGSGKTSLVNLLIAKYKATSGQILLNDLDIDQIKYQFIQRNVSYVGAKQIYYNLTILDNILLFALPKSIPFTELDKIIELVNLKADINKLPYSYDTRISDFFTLSTGQVQKIQIARSLLKNSPVMIFDEAFANIEFATKEALLAYLSLIKKDKIIIIISHNLKEYEYCDYIINMNEV